MIAGFNISSNIFNYCEYSLLLNGLFLLVNLYESSLENNDLKHAIHGEPH